MASILKETPLPAGQIDTLLSYFYANLSPPRPPTKGQTTVGHLWESCNAKPSADSRLFLAVFIDFLATGTACLFSYVTSPERGKESVPESRGSLLAPGSAFLENLAWIPESRNSQRPFLTHPTSSQQYLETMGPKKLELPKHLSSPLHL